MSDFIPEPRTWNGDYNRDHESGDGCLEQPAKCLVCRMRGDATWAVSHLREKPSHVVTYHGVVQQPMRADVSPEELFERR